MLSRSNRYCTHFESWLRSRLRPRLPDACTVHFRKASTYHWYSSGKGLTEKDKTMRNSWMLRVTHATHSCWVRIVLQHTWLLRHGVRFSAWQLNNIWQQLRAFCDDREHISRRAKSLLVLTNRLISLHIRPRICIRIPIDSGLNFSVASSVLVSGCEQLLL